MVRHFLYQEKALDEFYNASDPGDLLAQSEDSIFVDNTLPPCGASDGCLTSKLESPYMIAVHNARFIPSLYLSPSDERSLQIAHPISATPRRTPKKKTNLISTSDGHLFPESFCRYGSTGNPSSDFMLNRDHWITSHSADISQCKGVFLSLGILSAHFGHFLVDSLSQTWPLLFYREDIRDKIDGYVVFGGHQLARRASEWPDFIRQTLRCLSIREEQVVIVDRPTSFQKCLIPRKISPYNCGGGKAYNLTLQFISKQLQHGRVGKIYLSRSLANDASRAGGDKAEVLIEDLFRERGFQIIHPQLLPLSEQARILSLASWIAGCVGSQLHLMAFNENAELKVFRICPDYFAPKIDHLIGAGIGDFVRVTDYKVRCPAPRLARHKEPFLAHVDLNDLAAQVDEWLARESDPASDGFQLS